MTTENNQSLRERLAERLNALMFRYKHLDTQAKLAAASGVAQTTIGRILRCHTSATIDNIEAIAQAFGVDVTELFGVQERDRGFLGFDPSQVSSLPDHEKSRISSFIDYTLREYAMQNPSRLSFNNRIPAAPETVAASVRAASRPLQQGNSQHAQKQKGKGKPRKSRAA